LLVIAVLVLAELNVDISAFWGAAGIAGVALGLATQGLAKDIIRGLSLLVSNEVTVGDKVEIAGRLGVVEEVMVRRITLRDDSGAVHFVPCGAIGTVTNHSRDFSYAVLEIRVAQSTDIGRAIQAIRDVTQGLRAESDYATVILGPVEGLGFDRWTDWSIVLKAKVKVAVGKDSEVRHELFRRILARFEREGISYPQHSMSEPQASSAHESARGTVGA
jgi:small conductance mechanosensitive channel